LTRGGIDSIIGSQMKVTDPGKPDARPLFRALAAVLGAAILLVGVLCISGGSLNRDAVLESISWITFGSAMLLLAVTGRYFLR
jgi:hypothetical protein